MSKRDLSKETIALIDSLKSTTGAFGLAGTGSEYKIVTQMFLYKFLNDKFIYETKKDQTFGERLRAAEKWDEEYDKFTEEEVEDLFVSLKASVARLKPEHTVAHLYNTANDADFAARLDGTFIQISLLNPIFSVSTSGHSKVNILSEVTPYVTDAGKRSAFAKALMSKITSFNFEDIFDEKYDFFSHIFEYLLKGFNNAGGGKYAEYYTPRAIAQVMARLLVGDDSGNLNGMTCYDPSAGTGTLLMALAHQIGETKCSIYSQDISEKSSEMLRLNLVLNDFVSSLPNVVQGNTLTEPAHKDKDGSLRTFDFVVSNPPFKLDFTDYRDKIAADNVRFWAGVPNKVKEINPSKPKMAIYTCFIQHVLNSLKPTGKAAIVIPTGFITAKSGVEKGILKRIVDEKWVYGVVSMPSNVFATTGTNVSVLFFDKSAKADKVILIDASKLGEEYKEGNNQKRRLCDSEVDKIVKTFQNKKAEDDFSVAVTYDEIKEKGYSLSAGQYFDIKIDYADITEEEFNKRMASYKQTLKQQFDESHRLEEEILKQLDCISFNSNVGK